MRIKVQLEPDPACGLHPVTVPASDPEPFLVIPPFQPLSHDEVHWRDNLAKEGLRGELVPVDNGDLKWQAKFQCGRITLTHVSVWDVSPSDSTMQLTERGAKRSEARGGSSASITTTTISPRGVWYMLPDDSSAKTESWEVRRRSGCGLVMTYGCGDTSSMGQCRYRPSGKTERLEMRYWKSCM